MICWADTETGGLDENINPILSLGYVFTEDDLKPIYGNEILIKNKHALECNPKALSVNQIDLYEHEKEALDPKEAIKIFENDLKKYFGRKKPVFGGHNFDFDLRFINMMYKREDKKFVYHWKTYDTVHFFRVLSILGPIKVKSISMDKLMEYFNMKPYGQRHSALADVYDLLNLLNRCKRLRLLKAVTDIN